MNNSTVIRRMYHGPDANLLSFCQVILVQYEANMADFTAFDPSFNPAYATLFGNSIADARSVLPNKQVLAITSQYTTDLKVKMTEARDAFLMQKFFIRKAFADNPAIWSEFGFGRYKEVYDKPEKLLQFITELYETSLKYNTQLAAVGFGPTHITALANLIEQLQTQLTTQQLSISQQSTTTNQRITLYNTAWQMCRTICHAAKIIYAHDYGKYQCYFLTFHHRKKKVVVQPEEG